MGQSLKAQLEDVYIYHVHFCTSDYRGLVMFLIVFLLCSSQENTPGTCTVLAGVAWQAARGGLDREYTRFPGFSHVAG